MNKQNFYVDIHVLQTVPPSCVNRDDTGSPKTAVYGGATRARVSSQSWKHAMRAMFSDIFDKEDVGTRTKRVVDMVASKILQHNPDLDEKKVGKLAAEALKLAGLIQSQTHCFLSATHRQRRLLNWQFQKKKRNLFIKMR